MQLVGVSIGRGLATSSDNIFLPYRLVRPAQSKLNYAILRAEITRWEATRTSYDKLSSKGQLDYNLARRAQFTVDVLNTVGYYTEHALGFIVVCQAFDSRIIGAAICQEQPGHKMTLNLQCIDPKELPGSPGTKQLRGIGTALISSVAQQALTSGAVEIGLHPLDDNAAKFWAQRGFVVCGNGSMMCIKGTEAITKLRNICETTKDRPDQSECLLCGLPCDPLLAPHTHFH